MFDTDKIAEPSAERDVQEFELSNADFARLGMPQIVYVKAFKEDGVEGFQVCSADGQIVGLFESRDRAIGTALQQDLTPLSVH